MESQPQNPEFRNYPDNFPPCFIKIYFGVHMKGPWDIKEQFYKAIVGK